MSGSRQATLTRYFAIERAFEDSRAASSEPAARRFAAVGLVTTTSDPRALVAETMAFDARLGGRLSRWSGLSTSVRLGVAAALVKHGDTPDAFLDGLAHAQEMMAKLSMRRHEVYELIAYLALRLARDDRQVSLEDIGRVQAIYEAMKVHHYFLTGPEDLPWCALLANEDESPTELADRADAIYQILLEIAAQWRWDPLQTAGNMLALGELPPAEAADRLVAIAERFAAANYEVHSQHVDEFALLCFPEADLDELVATTISYEQEIHRRVLDREHWLSIPLATDLGFIEFARGQPDLDAILDAKLLLDLRGMVERDEQL